MFANFDWFFSLLLQHRRVHLRNTKKLKKVGLATKILFLVTSNVFDLRINRPFYFSNSEWQRVSWKCHHNNATLWHIYFLIKSRIVGLEGWRVRWVSSFTFVDDDDLIKNPPNVDIFWALRIVIWKVLDLLKPLNRFDESSTSRMNNHWALCGFTLESYF